MKITKKVYSFIDEYKSSLIIGSIVILSLMLLASFAYHLVVIGSIAFAIGLLGYLLWRK